MINRILICLDKSTYTDSAMEFACWLAKQHDASLEGLVVLDVKGIQRSEAMVPLGQIHRAKTRIAAKEKDCHQLIEELLGKFTERCDAIGVRHTEFEMQGTPAEAILKESNYFDCVVIGLRTFFTYSSGAGEDEIYGTGDDEPGDSLEEIMDHSLAPVFAVPLNWQTDDEFDVLIALNESAHSMRALRQFARLYGRTKVNVTLLNCSDGSADQMEMLTKAVAYLRAHGFDQVISRTESGEIRDVLDDEFLAPFDLVVLGAHGNRGAVAEFFTGSLCQKLIERQSKPLLISSG